LTTNSEQTRNQKKIFKPESAEELLKGWALHAHKGRDRHDETARQLEKYRYRLGVPTIILASIVGTSVFASLETQVDFWIKIIIGFSSVSAAILASLQTFYNHADRAERHRVAGVKYKAIIRELEQILVNPPGEPISQNDLINGIRMRLDTLESESPVVPENIYNRIEAKYSSVDFVAKVVEFF